jgi:hypothetical protein
MTKTFSLIVTISLLFVLALACKKESSDDSTTTTTGSTATTATTATTASTATTSSTASTASTATTSSTGSTASTATTSTTSTTSSTATTATTATTSTTSGTTTSSTSTTSTTSTTATTSTSSTTGGSGSFTFDGTTYDALTGSCSFSSGLNELTVTGTLTSGNLTFTINVEFPDTNPAAATYQAVYSASTVLTAGKCRVYLDRIDSQSGLLQELRASQGQNIILTRSGTEGFKITLTSTQFTIVSGGSAIRVVSATPFGCE